MKIWSKNENLDKNENFGQQIKFWLKICKKYFVQN